jgi:hypothetical protein
MPRTSITFPENMHKKVIKIAQKENQSLSYTITKLVEFGLLVSENNNKKNTFDKESELEIYCKKLIIQINGILKEIATDKFDFSAEKISQITSETLEKFNQLNKKQSS